MSNLRTFQAILQREIDPDDTTWSYNVENLPRVQQTNSAGFIKCVSVTSTDFKQQILLRLDRPPSNRAIHGELFDRLLLISFADFRLRWPSSSADGLSRLATGKENGNYMKRLLVTGIEINGVHYHFFGHSNSQLKSRSCFLYAAPKEGISNKIEAMGDFSKLKSVGKKAKRIGLLFSSAEMALTLSPDRCEDIDDIIVNEYIFTDGCGLMSLQFAKKLVQQHNIVYRGKRYLPSVYQIRYRGYKGVLVLDHTLQGQIEVQFRGSMRKFKDASNHGFSVVDYSKPYAFGYLNDEVVVLLSTLGIEQEILLQKQKDHLEFLQNVNRGDCRAAFQFLSYCDRFDLAEKLLYDGVESVKPTLQKLVKQEYARMLNKRDEQRCRILIPKSRLLFGVCDPHSKSGKTAKLKEGECFVRITLDGDGKPATIVNTEVLVTRNPCLHPGDLQKFKAVNIPEFSEQPGLVDCIVFPIVGKRPSADLMSGGDLDGDKFFVTWDRNIIPRIISEAAAYPGVKEPLPFKGVTDDDRAKYFARYTSVSLGRVKNLYLKWARLGNAMSPQCQQLNRLFSQCVDGNPIKVPQVLEDPPEPSPDASPFILDVLHAASTAFITNATNWTGLLSVDQDVDIMDFLLSRDKIAISEFELLKLTMRWCVRHSVDVMDYAQLLNFSALTDEQQSWFLCSLPPSATSPSLVRNGLLHSSLVDPDEFRRFGLDHHNLHWKSVFNSQTDRMGRFMSTVCRSLELFYKKFIILKVDERLTIAIYIPGKIERASEVQVDKSVRVFALPRSQGSHSPNYRVLPTKANYRLYCDESAFQLYELKRGNTWIFINRSQFNDEKFRNEKSKGDRRRTKEQTVENGTNFDCRISVALNKISSDIQRHVGRVNRASVLSAEIFVISNRDVASMKFLDQWLEYVDTDEVLPLFERPEMDYKIPQIGGVIWENYSHKVATVVRDKSLSQLRLIDSTSDLLHVLRLLNEYGEKSYLREVYSYMLSLQASADCCLDRKQVVSAFLDFLPEAVFVTPIFLCSQAWKTHSAALKNRLMTLAPSIFHELILVTNELHSFVRILFLPLLSELERISLQELADMVELISLTVRSPEAALDLLLEVLEPQTIHLLVGRPTATQQFVKCLFGIALDHVDEASNSRKSEQETLRLSIQEIKDGHVIVKSTLRIDSSIGGVLKVGDHLRLSVTNSPQNAPAAKPFSMDTLVLTANKGSATFRCLHKPPTYSDQCAWTITQCGSFVTSKTMFDAVTAFYTTREVCCRIYAQLVGFPDKDQIKLPGVELPVVPDSTLNESQNAALIAAMRHSLTFIWGPPGTGKTHTVVVILIQLLNALPKARVLVTAPTHNAVDNILRRFVSDRQRKLTGVMPLRVSTQLSKVSSDLQKYTCDAMLGKDLSADFPARRKAQKRIKEARLVFTTCAGSGLGLLRTESFDIVLIDEASQLTEPATLIPLVKGCSRAILVGDHVQLRATVQQNAVLTGFDVSLFERHYNSPEREGVAKVMLDTQYRMHRSLCEFSSNEFYESRLKTAVADDQRPIPSSQFPWPKDKRMVFVECASPEDIGQQSKTNSGQVELCRRVIRLLATSTTPPSPSSNAQQKHIPSTIAILTPYTRQKELLQSNIPSIEISSIDGFQGREADIVVFVTVRSNVHGELGFLTDMRRLNVVMTRAKTGLVVIGNRTTLTMGMEGEESKSVWKRLVGQCGDVRLPSDGAE